MKSDKALKTIAFNTQFIAGMNFGNELRAIDTDLDFFKLLIDIFFKQCKVDLNTWQEVAFDGETLYQVYMMTITNSKKKESIEIELSYVEYKRMQDLLEKIEKNE